MHALPCPTLPGSLSTLDPLLPRVLSLPNRFAGATKHADSLGFIRGVEVARFKPTSAGESQADLVKS